jgi:hypothetical protein
MSIPFDCPNCGKALNAANALAGRTARCTGCDAQVVVPTGEEITTVMDESQPEETPTFGLELIEDEPLQAVENAPQVETPAIKKPPQRDRGPMFPPSKNAHDEDLIDMTAMVDIVFFILIFFLVTSLQALQSVLNMPDGVCRFQIVREPTDAKLEIALSNSFGFGGANATLALRRWT